MDQATTICQLPVQLLARILAQLQPSERLGVAALVASAWRAAAVLATQAVSVQAEKTSAAVPGQINSLSAWLAAHSSAGITAIEVSVPEPRRNQPVPLLQLPLQRLRALESLRLANVAVAPAAGSAGPGAGGAAAPLLPLQLSAVTALSALHFDVAEGQLQGLSALTRLQSLSLGAPGINASPDPAAASHRAELVAALPVLQQLTFLQLSGQVAYDEVLQHIHSLHQLQHLMLPSGSFSANSFQQLPRSLERMLINWCGDDDATLSPSTAPGISQLTGLQHLVVYGGRFSLELLAGLRSLRSLELVEPELVAPGTLSVLAAMTQLSYLALPPHCADLAPSDQDTAAVTASAHLAELDICRAGFPPAACRHMFAAGRQLSQLTCLQTDLDLVCNSSTARMMAACCPNLRRLTLASRSQEHWEADPAGQDELACHLHGVLTSLQPLLLLTSLALEPYYLPMLPEVWQGLGRLTQLQRLEVLLVNPAYLPGVLQLRSCRRLQELHVNAHSLDLVNEVDIGMTGRELEDGTTTLHQELPLALHDAVLQQWPEATSQPELVEVLLKAAAGVHQAQQAQLAQQQGEIAELKQQVQALQAGLAAVLRQQQQQQQ